MTCDDPTMPLRAVHHAVDLLLNLSLGSAAPRAGRILLLASRPSAGQERGWLVVGRSPLDWRQASPCSG